MPCVLRLRHTRREPERYTVKLGLCPKLAPLILIKGGSARFKTARMERLRRSQPVQDNEQTWEFREHLD